MRKSRTINLLLLGGSILAFSACVCSGCGRNNAPAVRAPYDPPWHDAQGKPIAKEWKMDDDGHRTPAQTPYDSNGKLIAFDANGNPIAPAGYAYSTTSGSNSHYRSGGIGWWPYIFSGRSGSSYGSGYGSGHRSGPSNTGSTYFGGSKPGSSSSSTSKPSGGSSFGGGSVSRGGFGGSSSSAGS